MKSVRGLAACVAFGLVFAGSLTGCGKAGPLDGAKVLSTRMVVADDLKVTIQEVETPADVKASIDATLANAAKAQDGMKVREGDSPADDLTALNVVLDQIINMGKKVWAVVASNQPVLNIKFDFANALPKGVRSASDLAGFSDLQYKSFVYAGQNGFGAEVFKVQYTVVYQYGGSFEGKGAYISTASVVPQDVSVLWGYDLGMDVQNVAVNNLGTSESPVAGINLMAHIKVSTILKKTEINEVFAIRGDSGLLTRVQ
ncbi:MAG: hypothetical protein RIQ81_2012 [Pseudomonadota bacterium]|jgi:hypothetical protein